MNKNGIAITLPLYSSISAISVDCIYAKVHMVGLFWMTKEKCVGETVKIMVFWGCKAVGTALQPFFFIKCISLHFPNEMKIMKSNSKKPKKKQFSSVKSLLKAGREKEIEQYGKQVSMRPSKVHKSKKDYDRKQNKLAEKDVDND